jgi:predicted transcriptional regulator YheO
MTPKPNHIETAPPASPGKGLIFGLLRQMADAVATSFGPSCEVVIHDISDPRHAIVHMAGNVTRREAGAPISDAVVGSLIREGQTVKDRYNYKTVLEDGREIKSTTVFIRDAAGEVAAAFCINFDTTDHVNAMRALEQIVRCSDSNGEQATPLTETIAFSIDDAVDALFEQAVAEIGKQPASMSTEEKIRLVGELERKGAFQIRGVVNQVALRLGVTNFTVYNYLKRIRTGTAVRQ